MRTFFRGIEQPDMLADDFQGSVALDPLTAAIPTADTALGVEQVNRVVGNVIDQQLQLQTIISERRDVGDGLDHGSDFTPPVRG
jgi:hypothetical protein